MSNENAITLYKDLSTDQTHLYYEFTKIKNHFSNLTYLLKQLALYFKPKAPPKQIFKKTYTNLNTKQLSDNEVCKNEMADDYSTLMHCEDLSSMTVEQIQDYIERTFIDHLEDNTKDKSKELMKIKMKKKSLMLYKKIPKCFLIMRSKIYSVKIEPYNNQSFGWRIFIRFCGCTVCYGPYLDYNFSLNLKQTVQLELNKFDQTQPYIQYLAKVFLSYSKIILEEKYKPLKMQKP